MSTDALKALEQLSVQIEREIAAGWLHWPRDHACRECVEDIGGDLVRAGFRCARHTALALRALDAEPERERDENEPESLDAALREREAMLASGMWSGPRMSYLRGFIAALSRPAAPSEGER